MAEFVTKKFVKLGAEEDGKKAVVALSYEPEKDKAPLVLAVGKGTVAEEILKIAQENNIPLFEDRALVDLLSRLEIDAEIPPELYVLVAEVLAFVYKLDQMSAKRRQVEEKIKEEAGKLPGR